MSKDDCTCPREWIRSGGGCMCGPCDPRNTGYIGVRYCRTHDLTWRRSDHDACPVYSPGSSRGGATE